MLTEISPAWSLGNRPINLVMGQLDFTTVYKRMSLNPVQIFDTTCLSINHPSSA